MNIRVYIHSVIAFILMVALVGCDKWLDVRPESEVGEADMFETEQGYMDALYGVYVSMGKDNLYGGSLPLTMDVLGKLFDVRAGNEYENFMSNDYQSSECMAITSVFWERLYYCISLANNILQHLEEESPETLDSYNYLKGECLGLRAFLHYELLRIFAPNVKDKPDYVSIPYRKGYSNLIDPQLTVKKVFEEILTDLEAAKKLLENDVIRTETPVFVSGNVENEEVSDDVNDKNENHYMSSFLSNRKYRMNYYGVLATMARVYLDRSAEGDRKKAYDCAMEVIESGKFRLLQKDDFIVPAEDLKKRDALFTDEFVFGLYSTSVDGWYDKNCNPGSSFSTRFRLLNVRDGIFEGKVQDYRFMLVEQDGGSDDLLYRKHWSTYEISKQKIRILGLSEMYYIASEINAREAVALMDSIAQHRGLSAVINQSMSDDERMREIMKEYRKEFLADGQFFFAYKRLAKEHFWEPMNLGIRKDDKVLVLPLPEAEIEYGDRVSDIWK